MNVRWYVAALLLLNICVAVSARAQAPLVSSLTATLTAVPTTIEPGGQATLQWTSTNAVSCTGAGFVTYGASTGTILVAPTATTSYGLACTGPGGAVVTSVSVYPTSTSAPDTMPPSVPRDLSLVNDEGIIKLSWTASNDDRGVLGYEVYRDAVLMGTTSSTTFADVSATSTKAYTYAVKAFDAASNVSDLSMSALMSFATLYGVGARVATDDIISVWTKPGKDRGSKVRASQVAGAIGVIASGPVIRSGAWWFVNFDTGADGWVNEDDILVTLAAAEATTPDSVPTLHPLLAGIGASFFDLIDLLL